MGRPRYKDAIAAEMYAMYSSGVSLRVVAGRYGVSNQAVWEAFRRRGLALRPSPRKVSRMMWKAVVYKGRRYTPDKLGYLRATDRHAEGTCLLHRVIWEECRGSIPAGHVVSFRDGNRANCSIDNLELLTADQHRAMKTQYNNQYSGGLCRREFPSKCCRACGKPMTPHTTDARRTRGESPSEFIARQTCGFACGRTLMRGRPRGTKRAAVSWRAGVLPLPQRRAQTIAAIGGGGTI